MHGDMELNAQSELCCLAKKQVNGRSGAPLAFIETVHSIDLASKASIPRCAVAIMARSLMMSRLLVLTVFVLGLLAATAPQAQVAHKAPDASAQGGRIIYAVGDPGHGGALYGHEHTWLRAQSKSALELIDALGNDGPKPSITVKVDDEGRSTFLLSIAALATAAELRTMTHSGIPLDERILVRVRGVLLGIPAGYLWPWPGQDLRNRVNEWRGVDFHFWMPDRRYPEISPISYAGFRPKERGRGEPARDAYIVQVRGLQPIKLGEPGYISPEQGFRNSTSIAGIASYSFKNEEFGLVRFWNHDWPYPQPEPFTFYRHVEGSDPQVHLRCTPPHEKRLPFPGCAGEIHFATDDLGFFIHFPRDELPNWGQMVLA